MTYSLSNINIYPIKSAQGISLISSSVTEMGLLNDRRFMLVSEDGNFVTGRDNPALTLVKINEISAGKWQLSYPTMPESFSFDVDDLSTRHKTVTIWEDELEAQAGHASVNEWFSTVLGKPVTLVFFSDQSSRFTGRRPDTPVAFADGYPFHLTTEASLNELNKNCTITSEMARFRPNLVVAGNKAFEEDSWKRIKIGEVEFENIKPCVRCIFITLDPKTAERSKRGEPLKTLGKFRVLKNKGITFGVNLIALNSGVIHQEDPVEVLEYQEPEQYLDRRR
ncbi:MOSC domain-containing protein [Marinomonas sp.]|nr:MOSC domain-containing protein [Marinomonas sp.]MDB4837085.1 MOSC domain-containing protein [Marinomonas sp.]